MRRVSICIPTYNRAEILTRTLETIQNQTYGDFELVIVDNASTDNTEEVVRAIDDPRLRYVRNPTNVGLILNQNRAIEEARCELVAVYHDHDLYHPDLVRRSVAIFDAHPNVGLVCSAIHLVDPDDPGNIYRTDIMPWDPITPGEKIRRVLLHKWNSPIPAPTAMARRRLYQLAGVFQPTFGAGADRELWLRVLRHCDLGYIREPMARLRDRKKAAGFTASQAAYHWEGLAGEAEIQAVHLEWEFRHAPVRRLFESALLETMTLSEFWKWALWGIAKRETPAFFDHATGAFRACGMHRSAAVLNALTRSRLAEKAIGAAFQIYKAGAA